MLCARPCPVALRRPAKALGGAAKGIGCGVRRTVKPVRAALELHDSAAAATSALEHHARLLATLADSAAADVAATVTTAAAAAPVAAEAAKAADGGPFGFLADFFESVLKIIDSGLETAHVPYSYGFSIILLTLIVKLATFPLSQKQVQSTVALQALAPSVKELQAKHAGDPETLQLETARLYREAGVNPLAGCLPTLATIPVFIGLYNALTKAANDGLLVEGFFWIPSLAGPTSLADRDTGAGLSWLFPLVDGAPPVGWKDAASYLVLPVLLVVSQFVSQKIISPPQQSNDPSQQQAQLILKILPVMIGWFSLNVPSGLTLYWFINNILSTAQQVYLKNTTKVNIPETVTAPAKQTPVVKPKEERVKKLAGKDMGSRRKKSDSDGETIDVEVTSTSGSAATNGAAMAATNGAADGSKSKGSRGKGDKFRAIKAKEAAAKAASAATVTAPAATTTAAPPTGEQHQPGGEGKQ